MDGVPGEFTKMRSILDRHGCRFQTFAGGLLRDGGPTARTPMPGAQKRPTPETALGTGLLPIWYQ
jgi:hypothetical protein